MDYVKRKACSKAPEQFERDFFNTLKILFSLMKFLVS